MRTIMLPQSKKVTVEEGWPNRTAIGLTSTIKGSVQSNKTTAFSSVTALLFTSSPS